MNLFDESRPKLIVSRRAIAAGLAALVGAPTAAVAQLKQLTNVPLTLDASDFASEIQGGLFLPDYRHPMARLVFENGATTGWYRYTCDRPKQGPRAGHQAVAIEVCAPDKNGAPRYAQLAIG